MKKQLKSIKLWLKVIAILIFAHLVFMATCVGVYGQVGDCPAQHVCASGLFNAAVDITDELNASNSGCLLVNEGITSYWMRICIQTSGTFRFAINPSGNVDYDWACWSGANCPPTAMPIRCSFAIPFVGPNGDMTGASSANNFPEVDNSEGALGNNWTQEINAIAGECYIVCVNRYSALGSNTFLFALAGTATYTCSPLPVTMSSFTGYYDNNVVVLDWITESETNNSHFIIERMDNSFGVKQLARVEGYGYSNNVLQYKHIDLHPTPGINYYRLIQYDYNGDFKVYDWISVLVPEDNDECCVLYYNLMGQLIDFENAPSGIYLGLSEKGNTIKIRK